jgi:sodium/proline symporter
VFNAVTISFFAFLGVYVAVGLWSAKHAVATTEDYLLASRSINPWLSALSSVATDNSGFMFMGLTGSCYLTGLSGGWLIAGWLFGEWIAWLFVHRRLREVSERVEAHTIPRFLGHGLGKRVAFLAGLVTLFFLAIYSAAQLTAGSKALSHFDIDPTLGAVLGAVIVLLYCFSGGIRASIWTDAVQSVVMLLSIVLLLVVAVHSAGGIGATWDILESVQVRDASGEVVSAGLTNLLPSNLAYGFGLFILGWIAAGFGMVGQPHIMVRAMAIDSPDSMVKARRIYISWYILFAAACVLVGVTARALIPWEADVGREAIIGVLSGDAELAFPSLAGGLLGPVLVGLMLAGLFAATVSTADSQVLSCSAALSQDVVPRIGRSYLGTKLATIFVTAVALGIALFGGSVFRYVTFAWSGLAATLGPLLVVRAMGWRITTHVASLMMIAGLATVLAWIFALELNGAVYEALPGMLAGFLVHAAWALSSGGFHESKR